MGQIQLVSSYRGIAYHKLNDGRRLVVSQFSCKSDPQFYTPEHYQGLILPSLGTVRFFGSREACEFPPAEIMTDFPGYTRAKVSTDGAYTVIHENGRPAIAVDSLTGNTWPIAPLRARGDVAAREILARLTEVR